MIEFGIMLLAALPIEVYDEVTESLDKCTISGTIYDIKVIPTETCFDPVIIKLVSGQNYYQINGSINNPNHGCDGGGPTFSKNDMPKIGSNMDVLVSISDNRTYGVLSREKIADGEYDLIYGTISKDNFTVCTPNGYRDEIIYEDNKIKIETRGENNNLLYIYGVEVAESYSLYKNYINTKNKLDESELKYIDSIVSKLSDDKLVNSYSNFIKIDFTNIKLYTFKDFLNYLGYSLGIEIFKRKGVKFKV